MISVSAADQVWRWPCGADGSRRMLGVIPRLSASSWLVWTPTWTRGRRLMSSGRPGSRFGPFGIW